MFAGELDGRVAVVTGGSKGLGKSIALALHAVGVRVALLARPSAELDAFTAELGTAALACPCDIRSSEEVTVAIDRAVGHFGRLDILVNNAARCSASPMEAASDELVVSEIETNLMGPIWAIRASVPHLRASGRGHIVNVSSEIVRHPSQLLSIYAASKAGLEALSGSIEAELRSDHIRVTVLRVGRMSGSNLKQDWPEAIKRAFLSSAAQGGLDAAAGAPMDPATVAQALINILALPRDARVDLIEVRGA